MRFLLMPLNVFTRCVHIATSEDNAVHTSGHLKLNLLDDACRGTFWVPKTVPLVNCALSRDEVLPNQTRHGLPKAELFPSLTQG